MLCLRQSKEKGTEMGFRVISSYLQKKCFIVAFKSLFTTLEISGSIQLQNLHLTRCFYTRHISIGYMSSELAQAIPLSGNSPSHPISLMLQVILLQTHRACCFSLHPSTHDITLLIIYLFFSQEIITSCTRLCFIILFIFIYLTYIRV